FDITERRQAEETLRESEEKFRSVTETANDAIISADGSGKIIGWNKGALQIFGYKEEEALGKPLTLIMPEKYTSAHLNGFARYLKTGKPTVIGKTVELEGLHKDGRILPIEFSLSSWTLGKSRYFTAILRDVTERYAAQTALKKLDNAVNQATEAVIITDAEGIIEYVNPAFETISGYSMEEVIGKHTRILKSGKQDDIFYKNLWDTILSGEIWRGEIVNKRKSGELYPEGLTISPVLDKQGIITNFIAVKNDITNRKKAEEEIINVNQKLRKVLEDLKNTQSMLIRSEKLASMGALSAGVAHEIKNPLNIISTIVQLLAMEDGLSEEKDIEYKKILQQIDRAVKITENLRDFAKEREPEKKNIDLNILLNRTLRLVEYEMRTENIRIIRDFTAESTNYIGDPDQFSQVFLNIINNARESMNEKQNSLSKSVAESVKWEAILTAKTEVMENSIIIMFQDTGHGISPDIIDNVLDPFFTTKEKGTGLGMSISYGIIENHNGTLEIDSKQGEGAAFKITLPRNK
ncbi:MAG: PAS domain S-box protein, partial [Nitrospinota bacterium]